jgi:hypothetical protein
MYNNTGGYIPIVPNGINGINGVNGLMNGTVLGVPVHMPNGPNGLVVAQQSVGTGAQQWTGPVMMYTHSPPISPPGSPMAHVNQGLHHSHNQFVGIGTNIVANQNQDGLDDDERRLKEVLDDAADQIREAKRVVTKSIMRNHKHRAVHVQLLRRLGATAVESIPFMKPKSAQEALRSVSLLISNVSSKLVPEMKQRQKHIVYVMRIMEAYVRSMLSLVSKKEPDDEEDYEATSKDAIERILVKLQEAEARIPNNLANDGDTHESVDRIIRLCETIAASLTTLRGTSTGVTSVRQGQRTPTVVQQAQRASGVSSGTGTSSLHNVIVIRGDGSSPT